MTWWKGASRVVGGAGTLPEDGRPVGDLPALAWQAVDQEADPGIALHVQRLEVGPLTVLKSTSVRAVWLDEDHRGLG